MKILGPQDTGKGILIEMDAGYISPTESHNKNLLEQANKSMLDYSKPFEFYAVLQKYNTPKLTHIHTCTRTYAHTLMHHPAVCENGLLWRTFGRDATVCN